MANGVGGNDTNTLILLHIPAGGKKAVGFSIPRDDWVNFAGTVGSQQQGKIDQAYGVSMFYAQQQLKAQNPGISQNQLAFQGNEAGRKAAVDTVEQLTGVHIDHFAEVNLDGFYELANVLGGRRGLPQPRGQGRQLRRELPGRIPAPERRRRRWRSSASATACPTATWTGRTVSRRSSTRSWSSCAPRE